MRTDLASELNLASELVEKRRERYAALSDRVWGTPETNFRETASAGAHIDMLREEGFSIGLQLGGLDTAVSGAFGTKGPVIAILGEFDALPQLSQEAGLAECRPLVQGANGHGCGHNLLGAGALMAAAAVKEWLSLSHSPGRIRYIGCPAEEAGSAKSFMVREGLFDDVDVAICWHPGAVSGLFAPTSLACINADFHFKGQAAHAAASPHLGRSALDAVELMNVGANYLREHVPPGAKFHYAIVDAGGMAPNTIPANACVRYMIRSPRLNDVWPLFERISDIARGAAMMTGTSVEIVRLAGCAELVGNRVLELLMGQVLERLDPPTFDEADQTFARAIQATLQPNQITNAIARLREAPPDGMALWGGLMDPSVESDLAMTSTDVGTVSWVVPVVQCRAATAALGTLVHTWQMTAQGKSPAAHKGMTFAAKAMAELAIALFRDPAIIKAAKVEHDAFRKSNPFRNPVAGVDIDLVRQVVG
ncbi:aminobenzoyl-glutamate utilization protein B [Chelatococcus asaccharovorans]|uniref:Aminobenzoyl-glutamate utilization protein B n=1 Tax=Chelatococcus asaccharovorans TaxID=28210 RepID=A0A2V3U0C2_9HYPH|nr:aminobenzoyl-glutamate utilization protein B [Chelatococcus asaccharovorans]